MVIEIVKGHKFSDPVKLADFKPKSEQGVYAVYYGHSSGKKFCYIGSSENISKRGFPFSHISVHYMPESSKAKCLELERHLIDEYNPPCNKQ